MASDEPPYLSLGTEVSARYKGAFCEAKIKKVNKLVKCKVNFKNSLGSFILTDDVVKGTLRVGSTVEARHSDGQYLEAVISKVHDCSQYTVVFDDGDVTTLRRTSLCLKSGKHFAESETLDQLPLTNPEHFGTPVNVKSKRKRRSMYSLGSGDDEAPPSKSKKDRSVYKEGIKYQFKDLEGDLGRVVNVDYGDKRKKDSWFPGLVVSPAVQDNAIINHKEDFLIRSFKDGKYFTVCKKDVRQFKRDVANKIDSASPLKSAIEKAIQYLDYDVLPTHWDKDILLGKGGNGQDDQSDTETESSDDEPAEERDRFIAQLYNFMDERSTPINKAPSIGSKDLNLYKLFKLVQKFGGYNRVTNQTRWKNVYVKMGLPSLGPNGSVMVKHAYRKYLLGFEEIHKKLGYTMVGKESTRSGRSRNNRNLASFVAGPKKEVEEKKDNVAESDANRKVRASSMEDAHDTETRRASRVKSREDKEHKEDAVPPKKLKPDVVPKKETRNCGVNKMAEKSKDAGRGRQNRKDEIESQKVVEPATSLKRPGRKKSRVEEDAAKVDSVSNSLKNEEHIKNGPVSVGDRVKVEYVFGDQKKSYEAKVREIQIGYHYNNYLVHYTGWNMRYDEWINSTSIIECIPDSKQNAKKKQSSAPPPCQPPAPPTKVLDAAKAMKRGRPPGTGIVAKVPNLKSVKDNAPKLPPSRSPLPVSANKPNVTPASVPVSKVPKNSSSSSNEEVPVGRTVRSARLERKLSNQNLLSFGLEPKRRLRKTPSSSEALPNSSEDESESEPEIPVPRFSRRRKDSETLRRSCSLESNKRHNVKTASVKLEKAVVAGVSESDSRISTPDRLQDDADEDDAGSSDKDVIVDVLTESSESPTIEDIPTKEERSNDEIPNVECQESRIDEEKELDGVEANVTAPDREANVDLSVSSPVKTDESKPSENSAEIPIDEKEEPKASNVAKNTKKKGGKKKHKKQESSADKTDVRPEENEKQSDDKSGEATVEEDVPKKEVSAAVDDAAPTLEVVEMSAVDVVDEDQEMAEIPKICDDEGAIAVDPIETFPSKLDDVAMDSMNSEIPVLEEVGPARNENSDSVVEDTSKVESHNDLVEKCDGDVDETKVESTDAVKTKKKKAKEAKSKKNKKKEKKMKVDEVEVVCDDEEAGRVKGRLKKDDIGDPDAADVNEAETFLADLKNRVKRKKTKKSKGKDSGEDDKKPKKSSDDGNNEDVVKVKRSNKKQSKARSSATGEETATGSCDDEDREAGESDAGISLLCDEDVLPASPLPCGDSRGDGKSAKDDEVVRDCCGSSSLAALAPTLAAELQHSTSVIQALSCDVTVQQKEHDNETASHLLVDNTPPTTPDSSVSTTSVVSSPSHECSVESSPTHEINAPSSVKTGHDRDYDKFGKECSERDAGKKKKRHGKRSRSISESSRSSAKVKLTGCKDSECGSSNDQSRVKCETEISFVNSPPKSSKFNFYVPLEEYSDGAQRIQILQEKMCELRKTYMALKAEVAQIDRRRKRARKKEREAAAATNETSLTPVQCS